MAVPKNKALKQFNSYLEEVRGKLARHYRELQMKGERLTAAAIKDAYGGIKRVWANFCIFDIHLIF